MVPLPSIALSGVLICGDFFSCCANRASKAMLSLQICTVKRSRLDEADPFHSRVVERLGVPMEVIGTSGAETMAHTSQLFDASLVDIVEAFEEADFIELQTDSLIVHPRR